MTSRIRLCGRLEVDLGGERLEGRLPGRQGPLVFALLVVNRGRPVTRDELIEALWPGEPPADPEEALSAVLSKVRQAVGRDTLTGRRELTLALPRDIEVDWERAIAAAEQAQAAIAERDHETAWDSASAVLEITGRGFLSGQDAPWVADRRRELEELRLGALESVAAAGVAMRGPRLTGAERAARELVGAAPLREAGHRLLMEALAARGEPAEALAAYEHLRMLLREELGTAPGAAVRALHERLLSGDEGDLRADGARPVPLPDILARMGTNGSSKADSRAAALLEREAELSVLGGLLADASGGEGRLVVIEGSAGIGKTRLMEEARSAADGSGLNVLHARGASSSATSASAWCASSSSRAWRVSTSTSAPSCSPARPAWPSR